MMYINISSIKYKYKYIKICVKYLKFHILICIIASIDDRY